MLNRAGKAPGCVKALMRLGPVVGDAGFGDEGD
jgi:hypothetical protein